MAEFRYDPNMSLAEAIRKRSFAQMMYGRGRWDIGQAAGYGYTPTQSERTSWRPEAGATSQHAPYARRAGEPYSAYTSRIQGGQKTKQQPQLAPMIQQPPPQLGTFGTPAPQPQQQPKPKYDWQQPQTPTLQPGQPLPPTQQFGYAQPYAQQRQPLSRPYSYGQPQWPGGQPRPRRPQFGGLSQYFNY